MIECFDGVLFAQMMIHASALIQTQKQHINELNVFPVPDGDTGTNMSMTMQTAAAELKKGGHAKVGDAAHVCAGALLRGARGNSGVILSLLFRGFAKAIKDKDTANGRDLALALDYGVAAAYKAVMKPAEGTILTVSRIAAAKAAETAREAPDAETVLAEAIAQGRIALADTVNQNPVLQKAGVVDAGGMGFLVILQGMLDCLRGEPLPEAGAGESGTREQADFSEFKPEEILFGYCTEFICSRDNEKDPEALRQFLDTLGDSLVLVDDDEIIKVHVHTNHPGRVLEEGLTYGALLTVKVENLHEQHTALIEDVAEAEHRTETVPAHEIARPERKYGVVAVTAGNGLTEVFRDLGTDGVISGGQTMNPSTEDILREVNRTPAEVVFVLPNNKNIIMAAEQCVHMVREKQVIVIPTRSVPQGISALIVLDPDATIVENETAMRNAMERVKTSEITYAARDSDFDGVAIKQGDYLALTEQQLFGTDRDLKHLLKTLAQAAPQQEAEFINIFYGEDITEKQAQQALEIFTKSCPNADVSLHAGGQPVYYYTISAE